MTVPFMYNFEAYIVRIPYDFLNFNFHILFPKLGYFS